MPTKDEPAASTSNEFASFLAKLNSASALATCDQPWDDSSLADDSATISYEQGLRNAARSNVGRSSSSPIQTAQAARNYEPSVESSGGVEAKNATISIRLTRAECAQLRQRAAQAGLTVSDYLRTCLFEVESLRTQVREVLLQLRSASSNTTTPATAVAAKPESRKGKGRWFWPFGNETPAARLESRGTALFTRAGSA